MEPNAWLAERCIAEQNALRDMEEKLFNWSATVFISSFGALAGLAGIARDGAYGPTWRPVLWGGVILLILCILFMAYQIRRDYFRKQTELNFLLSQMSQAARIEMRIVPLTLFNGLFFYVRWTLVTVLGLASLVLINVALR